MWSEKSDGRNTVDAELLREWKAIGTFARKLAEAYADAGLPVDKEEYAASFRPELMPVLAHWSTGADFRTVLKMADAFFEVRLLLGLQPG